ncbi:hypothetical protein A3651_03200 [Streptococcus gallolyticus subsp. gallolyticus]|nr:hypothetical protein A3651_03200 [Streptococcus gallolyticus subsp. gallolyticus]
MKLSAYEHKIWKLSKQLQKHQEALQKLMVFNNDRRSIIYSYPMDNHFWIITVECLYNHQKRLTQLKFELYDLLDKHPVDRFQGQLWMDVLYTKELKAKGSRLKGFWIYEFKTLVKNKGYGSLLLSEALWYISQHFGTSIEFKGWLSFVDERDPENHARRDHVYQKFGFEIDGEYAYLRGILLDKLATERAKRNS